MEMLAIVVPRNTTFSIGFVDVVDENQVLVLCLDTMMIAFFLHWQVRKYIFLGTN